MAPRAVLFDLDGTIWDSYPWYASAVGLRVGSPEIIQELRAGHSIVALLRNHGVPERALFQTKKVLDLFPTVHETLTTLRKRGVPIAAVTNLPGRIALPMLERAGLQSSFNAVVHAGNCRALKPHPRPIFFALSELGISGAQISALYVGDTATDATAAFRAGVPFGWAAYGYGPARPESAEFVLERLSEVLTLNLKPGR